MSAPLIDLLDDSPAPSQQSYYQPYTQQPPPPPTYNQYQYQQGYEQQPPPAAQPSDPTPVVRSDQWACPTCTYINKKIAPVCEMCQEINPTVVDEAKHMTSNSLVPATAPGQTAYTNYSLPGASSSPTDTPRAATNYTNDPWNETATHQNYIGGGGNGVGTTYNNDDLYYGGNTASRASYYNNDNGAVVPYDSNYDNRDLYAGGPTDTHMIAAMNETGEHKKYRRRGRRRARMAVGGATGLVVGAAIGPVGAVMGAAAGVAAARTMSKNGERKKDARVSAFRDQQTAMIQYQQQQPGYSY